MQRYNTPHPACHLLSFSIRKKSKNMLVTHRHSAPYKRRKIFKNFPVTERAETSLTCRDACVLLTRISPRNSKGQRACIKDARAVRPYLPDGKPLRKDSSLLSPHYSQFACVSYPLQFYSFTVVSFSLSTTV